MSDEPLLQIVPGVHISPAGEVTTSPELHDVLCDVAGELALLTSTMIQIKDEEIVQANTRIAALQGELDEHKGLTSNEG